MTTLTLIINLNPNTMRNKVKVTPRFCRHIEADKINNIDLRSDLENNNIHHTKLVNMGRISELFDFNKDLYRIDCLAMDGSKVCSYDYASKFEYSKDLELILEAEEKSIVKYDNCYHVLLCYALGRDVFGYWGNMEYDDAFDNVIRVLTAFEKQDDGDGDLYTRLALFMRGGLSENIKI